MGQSSFTAHSAFAIDLAQTVVGSTQLTGGNREVETLLGMLNHIRTAFTETHDPTSHLFPLIQGPISSAECQMPPLSTVVQLLQKCFMFLGLSFLLKARSLSDLCLKVYFTSDYSDAEFIIVNAALHFMASETDIRRTSYQESTEPDSLSSMCQRNLEIALSKLTLYVQPSYDMTLALTLGVSYAVHVSNASLAGVLANSAYQSSYSLGLHKQPPDGPKQEQCLFWMIYFLEKTLSVRLGRSSIILEHDIETPSAKHFRTENPHFSAYAYHTVQVAGLAGRIHEQLYSPKALSASDETRTHRALELSQELHGYHAQARNANQFWAESTSNIHEKDQIEFTTASDEVMRLSMLTLIYRAMPQGPGSRTTFGPECITSARCALESHQAVVRAFGMQDSPLLLSSYTRDKEDLTQMHSFLKSIESACPHSSTITKHHHLFSVFYNVAQRYYELGSPSPTMEEEQMQLRSDVDAQLAALGLQTHMMAGSDQDPQQGIVGQDASGTAMDHLRDEGDWEQDPWLARWFSFNQQMMGLVDGKDLPF
ncbi:uncharacterized protein N7506_008282 [Penicillium brevicompactum]|uniref:uncharacterized protein n=1 Tax=Penicillium brevicompactum TaxID=5074 RepID=UPI002540D700|nr:uncharacterized protein N7506_008282 [Penicillium brevicompactum]KAJ5325180.1 hypothetical protein N7506_008282 [Penicillium brevicompactum]